MTHRTLQPRFLYQHWHTSVHFTQPMQIANDSSTEDWLINQRSDQQLCPNTVERFVCPYGAIIPSPLEIQNWHLDRENPLQTAHIWNCKRPVALGRRQLRLLLLMQPLVSSPDRSPYSLRIHSQQSLHKRRIKHRRGVLPPGGSTVTWKHFSPLYETSFFP